MAHALMIAGTNSGVGKTSITISLISAFKKLNYNVFPYKVGPDFIDTGYHSIVSNNNCINLDGWMLSKEYIFNSFYQRIEEKSISIVEGVMGLYDGFSGTSEDGSSAQIAKWLNIPVVLVINAKSLARSVAAIINGYKNFDKDVKIRGVILNNVGSENHFNYLKEAIEKYCEDIEIIGYFLRGDFPELGSRHLGLITVDDNKKFFSNIDKFGEIAIKRLNFEKIFKLSECSNYKKIIDSKKEFYTKDKKVKIAVAKDNAFCFYYYDNLKIFEKYGAEIKFFSPLYDSELPSGVKFIYFGGGYPELYAHKLSSNKSMINNIKDFCESGGLIYGECGGFMYLTDGIIVNKRFYPMCGIFKEKAIMENKLKALGYREIMLNEDCFFGNKGEKARGHEFHYSKLLNNGKNLRKIYKITPRKKNYEKEEGYIYKNCIGSYIHLHFGSNENFVKNLFMI